MVRHAIEILLVGLGLVTLPDASVFTDDDYEWGEFWIDAYEEYADEFTALFNSYEFKQAKNGAPMIRRADEKSYRFVPRGK